MIIVTSSFPFKNVLHPQTKQKAGVSDSSGLDRVHEKHRFDNGLVWTVGLTLEIKLRFQISRGVGGALACYNSNESCSPHLTYPLRACVAHRAFTELFPSSRLVAAVRTSSHDLQPASYLSFSAVRLQRGFWSSPSPFTFWRPAHMKAVKQYFNVGLCSF